MSQGFAFMRQKRAFLPDMQFQWNYTINPDFAKDMCFSEFLPAAVSAVSGLNNSAVAGIVPAVSAAAGTPTIVVQELYADLMYAVPRVAIPRGPSIQVPYQGISVYHRQLTANKTFTEVFSGIPASIGMVAVALRDPASSAFVNSELYKIGGDPNYGFSRFSLQLGALQLDAMTSEPSKSACCERMSFFLRCSSCFLSLASTSAIAYGATLYARVIERM